jgi:hypothetical protein
MEGSAMFTEEPMKGVRKEVNVATSRAARLVAASSIMVVFPTIEGLVAAGFSLRC